VLTSSFAGYSPFKVPVIELELPKDKKLTIGGFKLLIEIISNRECVARVPMASGLSTTFPLFKQYKYSHYSILSLERGT
jgi:hypothetical protein